MWIDMSGGDLRPSSPRRLDLRSASDARVTKTRLRRDTKSLPALGDGVSGRDEQEMPERGFPQRSSLTRVR